jgi:hypothetical protein
MPQINTVGYLTTAAGSMAAGYALGLVSRRFQPPFTRLQMNLSQDLLDTTNEDSVRQTSAVADPFVVRQTKVPQTR